MESHLHHKVKPLGEVRSEIPQWACDWIMWHLNRYPQDRPDSAREALSVFLKNDRIPNPTMSLGFAKPAPGPPRPRLVIPGSGPPARGNGPATQALAKAKLVQTSHVTAVVGGGEPLTQTAPQPLAPPEGFKPSVHVADEPPSTQKLQVAKVADSGRPTTAAAERTKRPAQPRKKSPQLGKKARMILMSVGLVVLLILSATVWKLLQIKQDRQAVTDLIAQAGTAGTTKVKVTADSFRLLVESMPGNESDSKLQGIAKALTLAEASDGTDVDTRIAEFATKRADLSLAARELLIGQVLQTRNNPVILPVMLACATSAKEPELVVSSLQALRQMAGDGEFKAFLKLLETSDSNEIRVAAELNLEGILRKSKKPADLAQLLNTARESNLKPEVQKALRRLISVSNSLKP
jgi:hypothetical protein